MLLLEERARRLRTGLTVLAVACTLGAAVAAGATESYSEDAVKAAFLYRFTGYVDWPPQALSDSQFTIAVLGADGVATELDRLLQNRVVQNRPAQVRSIKSIKELAGAQMLYIGASHRDDLRHIIAATAGRPVLIVTNEDGGLDGGSTVNFLLVDQRVRFEISLDAAQSSGLRVASELLAVAIRVRGKRLTEMGCDEAASEVDACIREAARR
jgi:YfiR/HmsC-like